MTATKYGGNSQSLKDEYEASFNTVIAILDEIAKVFKDEKMSFEKYASLLTAQHNMGGFMKSILVKRLESSFYAFKNTLGRFLLSYEKFLAMYEKGDRKPSMEVLVKLSEIFNCSIDYLLRQI